MPKGEASEKVDAPIKGKRGGKRPGSGRKKGVPNKTTASMRQAWIDAFEQMGGVKALVAWGKSNPDDFYKSATKLIPTDITSGDKPLVLLPEAERDARLAVLLAKLGATN